MSRTFAFVTLGLTAMMAFIIGLVVAGSMSAPSIAQLPAVAAPPAVRSMVSSSWLTSGLVNFADVVERINPAVVNIEATSARPSDGPERRRRMERPPLEDGLPPPPGGQSLRPQSGSGFMIESNGVILT